MTTPQPETPPCLQSRWGSGWRDIIDATADGAPLEGFALEHLIDLHMAHRPNPGDNT